MPLETSSCNNGSGATFNPTAGAAGVAAAVVSDAGVFFAGALASLPPANAAKGRSNTARVPANIRFAISNMN
jgi:hypothetical protein